MQISGYVGQTAVDSRREEVKIVVIRKLSSQDIVQQNNGFWEDIFRTEISPYQWNTN